MAIYNDFTIYPKFKIVKHTSGTTVYTMIQFFSWLMDTFDEPAYLTFQTPITSQTPSDFTMTNGWFIDDESVKYLKGGALKTLGYNNEIRVVTFNSGGYTSTIASDLRKGVTQTTTGHTGVLLYANNTTRKWWIRSNSASDTFNTANSISVDSGTGAGTPTAASVTGEELYSNIFTLGTIETTPKPITYIYQGTEKITGWWSRGDNASHIDVLIKVKEAGTLIESGIVTLFIRQYADYYDNFKIDVSAGGRNAVPLASQSDSGNNTLGEAYLLFDNQTANFTANKILTGQTSGATAEIIAITDAGTTGYLTLGNVIGTFQNNEEIRDDNGTPGIADINGTIGDTILSYDTETAGFTTLGQIVTGALSGAQRTLRGVQDNGTTGILLLQATDTSDADHYKVYSDNELVTGATDGSATANGVSTTTSMGFSDIKITFMNVEVDFSSKTGVVAEGSTVTGASSGATARFLGEKDSNTIMLGNWDGVSFTNGEQLQKDGSNYYTLASPTQQNVTHLIDKAFQLQSSYPYSVVIDGAVRSVAQIYERLKYLTREGANSSQIARQIMYPVIDSVVTQQDGEEYVSARVLPDTEYVQAKASPLATFSGGKLFGAQGVWIQNVIGTDVQAYQLVDANGVTRTPPNFQTILVSGVASGDRVTVMRTSSGVIVDKAVFTATAGNNIGNTTFVVNEAIPSDTPSSGIIRIVDVSDTTSTRERRYSYSSWATSTFSGIVKTFGDLSSGLDRSYTATDDTAFVPYIDIEASSTEVSQTIIYTADRTVVTWVRKYAGASTMIPFEVTGTLSSSGYSISIIRTIDPIAT